MRITPLFAALVVLFSLRYVPAAAEDLVWATGRVCAAHSDRPMAGAIVAVYDDKNRVIDYAKTDENGEYTLAVPRSALHLDKKGGGFFHQVVKAAGDTGLSL